MTDFSKTDPLLTDNGFPQEVDPKAQREREDAAIEDDLREAVAQLFALRTVGEPTPCAADRRFADRALSLYASRIQSAEAEREEAHQVLRNTDQYGAKVLAQLRAAEARIAKLVEKAKPVVDCWGVGSLNITALGEHIEDLRQLLIQPRE